MKNTGRVLLIWMQPALGNLNKSPSGQFLNVTASCKGIENGKVRL